MCDGNKPEKKKKNSNGKEHGDGLSITNAKPSENTTTPISAINRTEERFSRSRIRTPLILQARVSKSNWYETPKKAKIDLFQNILPFSISGSQNPYISEGGCLPSSTVSTKNENKTVLGSNTGERKDSAKPNISSSQGTKRKIVRRDTHSEPKSKRLLYSLTKNSTTSSRTKLDKHRTKSLSLLRRSSSKTTAQKINSLKRHKTTKTYHPVDYFPNKFKSNLPKNSTVGNVLVSQDVICTCSNCHGTQSKTSSKTKSAQTRRGRSKKSSRSSVRKGQSRASASKSRKSRKTSVKRRKSRKTAITSSRYRVKSKQRKPPKSNSRARKPSKNKDRSRKTQSKNSRNVYSVKSMRNGSKDHRIITKRESKVKRLQARKYEPLKVQVKEKAEAKKAVKKEEALSKKRFKFKREKFLYKSRANFGDVHNLRIISTKACATEQKPDIAREDDKTKSLLNQGDTLNIPVEPIIMTNTNAEIQCCLLKSPQCSQDSNAQNVTLKNTHESSSQMSTNSIGEHLTSSLEGKKRNSDQKFNRNNEIEECLINTDNQVKPCSFTSDVDSQHNSETENIMREQPSKSNTFNNVIKHNSHFKELEDRKISNSNETWHFTDIAREESQCLMNGNNQIYACNQPHSLTLPQCPTMESRITDTIDEQITTSSNTFNNSKEFNKHLSRSRPEDKSTEFSEKALNNNELKVRLNSENQIHADNKSPFLTPIQDLELNSGIDYNMIENTNSDSFGESNGVNVLFSNPPAKSNSNSEEQVNTRNDSKECVMVTPEYAEDSQHNPQSFMNENLPTQSKVKIDATEENANSSTVNGQWKAFNIKCGNQPKDKTGNSDNRKKSEECLPNTEDQTGKNYQFHLTESAKNFPVASAKEMTVEENADLSSILNESKRLIEQLLDLSDDRNRDLGMQSNTNGIELHSTNVYNEVDTDSQPHLTTSVHNLTLASVLEKVMKENKHTYSSSNKSNGTHKIHTNKDLEKTQMNSKESETPQSESMALLPYFPPVFVNTENENHSSLLNGTNKFEQQLSHPETMNINDIPEPIVKLVSLSLSQAENSKNMTYSPDHIKEIESQIRTLRCIYIQESDSVSVEDQEGTEVSSDNEDDTSVTYIRTSTSLLLQRMPSWVKHLYYKYFHGKK